MTVSQVSPQDHVRSADSAQGTRFLLVFALLSTLMGTSVGIAKVATSLYALELHASDSLLGLIAASQTVGVLLVSVPIGVLVDRYGPARPFMLGSVCAGAIYALLPLVPSTWFLLAGTAAISFFMPFRFVSLNTLFMRELVRIGVSRAGWYRGTHMLGMMLLGPVFAVWSMERFSFSGTYRLIALL
ncbi:MAG TPA: MFS transporter, partial [Polyangiaceae bacterium]|nr:MFS transporter [Polyangiaceae bacterium]